MRTCAVNIFRAIALLITAGRLAQANADPDAQANADPDARALAARVVIVANASSEQSLALARHYAKRRGIPEANIVALPMTTVETIGWREFIDTVYTPLQDELAGRGWIEGATSALVDKLGRKRIVVSSHRISYLVTCRGVPLRIEHDPALYEEVKPYTVAAAFRTNSGAVDAELAAIVRGGYAINAYLPNPLFQKERPTMFDLGKVVKVSRLDGPTWEHAMKLVDQAIEAEASGLIGRAYVDAGGPHAEGDGWMKETAKQLEGLGYDVAVDLAATTLAVDARFDAPALYFGWYAGDVNGPFVRPGFRFPPGAVALHLHSFSATTLHSATSGWCGPLLARGVTATFGNVFEPYLTFTHHPHLLLRALARGETLGDATFYSLRAISWQAVVIGDPLYRPFATDFATQWARRTQLSDEQFPYVVIRETRRLEAGGRVDQAIAVLREACAERVPTFGVLARLVELLAGAGLTDEAANVFGEMARLEMAGPDCEPITRSLVRILEKNKPTTVVVDAFGVWLVRRTYSGELRRQLLEGAISAAEKSGAADRAAEWRGELKRLRDGP